MRILFVGAVRFSRTLLEVLVALRADIVGVVGKPSSTFHADFAALDDVALAKGIPFHATASLKNADSRAWMKARRADIVFCFGWSELFDAELLTLAPRGVAGYHPALLPRNRGRHPIIWALALGLAETGSTFFLMDSGADSGPILSQRRVPIAAEMDADALYRRLEDVAAEQLKELWQGLVDGTLKAVPQDETQATYWRRRSPVDGRIDWRMPTHGVCNLVRALARPYPGATISVPEGEVVVFHARDGGAAPADVVPGSVLAVADGCIRVKTGDGSVELLEWQPSRNFKTGEIL